MQLAHIFTDLVPEILLKVLTHHITLNKAFQDEFGKKRWDGGQKKHRKWLADIMEKNPRVKGFSCAAMRDESATAWDVTNLSAALSAVMEPSDVPCDVDVTQACSKSNPPKAIDYFKVDVSVSERTDCKSWEGFCINVTGASPPEVVECIVTEVLSDTQVEECTVTEAPSGIQVKECTVTEAPSDTQIVAVGRKKAKDRNLPQKIRKYMKTEVRPVHLPLPEVQDIVKVKESRNALYHQSKTEVSHDVFTQRVASVRCLIEQALRPYLPKEKTDSHLTKLDKAANSEFLHIAPHCN